MPTSPFEEPFLSAIYRAFDAGAHLVFRTAMAHSRGGIVRVADLIMALCEYPEFPAEVIPVAWRNLSRMERQEPWLTPTSNEPALNDVLKKAHRIAQLQSSSGSLSITPPILLAATLLRSLQERPFLRSVLIRWGLRLSAEAAPTAVSHSSRQAGGIKESHGKTLSPEEAEKVIEETFRKWIHQQS